MLTQPNKICISTKLITQNKCENPRVDTFSGTCFRDKNITMKKIFTRIISAKLRTKSWRALKYILKSTLKDSSSKKTH